MKRISCQKRICPCSLELKDSCPESESLKFVQESKDCGEKKFQLSS